MATRAGTTTAGWVCYRRYMGDFWFHAAASRSPHTSGGSRHATMTPVASPPRPLQAVHAPRPPRMSLIAGLDRSKCLRGKLKRRETQAVTLRRKNSEWGARLPLLTLPACTHRSDIGNAVDRAVRLASWHRCMAPVRSIPPACGAMRRLLLPDTTKACRPAN